MTYIKIHHFNRSKHQMIIELLKFYKNIYLSWKSSQSVINAYKYPTDTLVLLWWWHSEGDKWVLTVITGGILDTSRCILMCPWRLNSSSNHLLQTSMGKFFIPWCTVARCLWKLGLGPNDFIQTSQKKIFLTWCNLHLKDYWTQMIFR